MKKKKERNGAKPCTVVVLFLCFGFRERRREWKKKWKKKQFALFCAEPRQQKRPLWKGDDTLCGDGRSCEFFLMCWMSAGLLDGSCGGIMFACCQRREPKGSSSDYNLIEAPRDQSQPLSLDTYTETVNDDRKSFLQKACHPILALA